MAATPVADIVTPVEAVTVPTAPVAATPVTEVETPKLTVTEPTDPVPATPVTGTDRGFPHVLLPHAPLLQPFRVLLAMCH